MKKILTLMLTLLLTISMSTLTSCLSPVAEADYLIGVVDGAPALVTANFYDGVTDYTNNEQMVISAEIHADPAVITAGLTNGTYDMAVLPLNVGAKLFNKGVDIKLASVNIFGVLYMIGNSQIDSLTELKGHVVYNIGRGGTPDLSFKYLLEANNIEYEEGATATDNNKVYLQYVSASSELIPLLKAGKAEYGIMGEPAITQANTVAGTQIVVDFQAEWKKLQGDDSQFVQAGLFMTKKVYENEQLVETVLNNLAKTTSYINENLDLFPQKLLDNGSSLNVSFTQDVIERCNLGCVKATQAKTQVETYFNAIMAFDSTFVGGQLPNEEFYL